MADERTREVARPVDSGERVPVRVSRLKGLLRAAHQAQGGARGALATEVNQVLATLGEPGDESSQARAQVLVAELDAHAFDNLIDENGVSSRKQAVQALLGLGFPHALQVDPADLDFTRKEEARERKLEHRKPDSGLAQGAAPNHLKSLQTSRTVAALVAGLCGITFATYSGVSVLTGSVGSGLWGLLQVLVSAGSTLYLTSAMPPVEKQGVPIAGVAFGLLLAVSLLPAAGIAAAVAAAGSLVSLVVLLGWRHGDPEG